ncbi:hypothetical protein N431DRAFT_399624 [Stipitochalara longipes BDJ]|nr:hypothetical protein N431DRAFT_399624 [Stipitochalara longipes BDJ]
MFFKSVGAASLLALCSLSSAASLPHKRSTESGVSLFVYGTDTGGDGPNGGPIFYVDGLAYVGTTIAPSWATVATNITFTLDPDSTTTAWTISPNSSTVTFNSTESMYIIPTTGSFTQVGFSSSTDTLPTDAVTTGFTFFGTNVAYAASDSNYELMFWASATNTSGVYALYWNAAASTDDLINGSFPVTVKTTAPTVLSA